MPTDEFRQYYATLSEEGLREIDRDDLTEIARTCYDDELALRGITIEGDAPESPAEDATWVAMATLPFAEIELARELLDAAEIPSRVEHESKDSQELVLLVPEPLVEQAREVLAAQVSEEELIAQAEAYEPPEDA